MIDRESQSALLLGYTGTGKSLVLDRVLRSLAQEAHSKAGAAAAAGGGKRKRQKKDSSGAGAEGEGGGQGGSAPLPPPTRHQQQEQQRKQPFRAVYLNGAAQADDGVAMREIVQQLGITGAASQGSIYNRSDQSEPSASVVETWDRRDFQLARALRGPQFNGSDSARTSGSWLDRGCCVPTDTREFCLNSAHLVLAQNAHRC